MDECKGDGGEMDGGRLLEQYSHSYSLATNAPLFEGEL